MRTTLSAVWMVQAPVGTSLWKTESLAARLPRGSMAQYSVASMPLSRQYCTLFRPLAEKKDLFSSPWWTWLITFFHSWAAGLPEVRIFSF